MRNFNEFLKERDPKMAEGIDNVPILGGLARTTGMSLSPAPNQMSQPEKEAWQLLSANPNSEYMKSYKELLRSMDRVQALRTVMANHPGVNKYGNSSPDVSGSLGGQNAQYQGRPGLGGYRRGTM